MSRARDFADLAGSADAGGLTGRNILINGAMQVSQRGTSATATTANGVNVCDRWHQSMSSSGTFTLSQSSTAPSGFANSFKFDCTAADSSPSNIIFAQRVEGQNLQMLKKGTSDALSATLSFYIRSNKTGTYQVNMYDTDNTRIIGKTYTIDSADTWEYKTLTFAGDTSGAFADDNGGSLELEWWFAAGSTYNSGAVPTAWEAKSDGDRAAGLTVNLGDTVGNTLFITGVQLEVGEQATPFEHRSYADELARCQRYFVRWGGDSIYERIALGQCISDNDAFYHLVFPQTMRALGTLGRNGCAVGNSGAGATSLTSLSVDTNSDATHSTVLVGVVAASSFTAGDVSELFANNSTAHYIEIDAEL